MPASAKTAILIAASLITASFILGCGSSGTTTTPEDNFTHTSHLQTRIDAIKLLLPESVYNTITEQSRNNAACREANRAALGLSDLPNGQWYYTYDNMIAGMAELEEFASEGDENTRKLEIASFLANVAQETGGKVTGDPYGSPGCFIQEGAGSARDSCSYGGCVNTPGYDDADTCKANDNKCPAGDFGWCGRGPHQLSWGSNYGSFGETMGVGNVYMNEPDQLVQDPEIGIAGSIWFWGHQESSSEFPPEIPFKPSAHNVVVGNWTPTQFDEDCGRTGANLGVITNIINGGIECGPSATDEGRQNAGNRVLYFNAIAGAMGVIVPDGWADDCSTQRNFQQCPSYMDQTKRCGAGWQDANTKCGTLCLIDSDCPSGETCFSGLDTTPCSLDMYAP